MDERVAVCQDLLNMINGDKNFLEKVVTGEESWCFAYNPETKHHSSKWDGEHSPQPKKLCFHKSKVKTRLIVFFDSQGIVHKSSCKKIALLMQNIIKVLDHLISCI